jgi:hypothetical protein
VILQVSLGARAVVGACGSGTVVPAIAAQPADAAAGRLRGGSG